MTDTSPVPQPPSDSSEDDATSGNTSAEGATGESAGEVGQRTPSASQFFATGALLEDLSREAPGLAALRDPEVKLLAAGWLAGFRSPRTRRAYGGDLVAFDRWCTARGLGVLGAGRVQVDLYVTDLLQQPQAASSVSRRISALSSFYNFVAAFGSTSSGSRPANPTTGVRRPRVNAHVSPTLGLNPEQAAALVSEVDRDRGSQRLRSRALIRLLLHNALRVDEVINANRADFAHHPGRLDTHVTLKVTRKGGRRALVALAPSTVEALERYLATRPAPPKGPEAKTTPLLCEERRSAHPEGRLAAGAPALAPGRHC